MRKIWAVIRREFVERVRSKWFWASAILGPVFFGAIIIIPLRFASTGGTKAIVVVDGTASGLGARVADSLARGKTFTVVARSVPRPGLLDSLTHEVGRNRLDGLLVLTDRTVETGAAEYRAANVSSFRDIDELRGVLGRLAVNARLERAGVDPATVGRAQIRIDLETRKISGSTTTGESSAQSFWLAYVMSIVLFIVIAVYGVNVMSSVLEEKTTRVVEVLVSSLRPFQLMLGKVVGVGAVSIFQFAIWGLGGRLVLSQRAALLGTAPPGNAGQEAVFQLPPVPAATVAVFLAYVRGGGRDVVQRAGGAPGAAAGGLPPHDRVPVGVRARQRPGLHVRGRTVPRPVHLTDRDARALGSGQGRSERAHRVARAARRGHRGGHMDRGADIPRGNTHDGEAAESPGVNTLGQSIDVEGDAEVAEALSGYEGRGQRHRKGTVGNLLVLLRTQFGCTVPTWHTTRH